MASKHRISVTLSDREYQKLSSLAEQYKVSMAWLGRKSIEGLLEKLDNEELSLQRLFKK